jgi:hypothetical protein
MSPSRIINAALVLGAIGPLVTTGTARAQYVPYARYGAPYGWGAYPNPSAPVIPRGMVAAQKGADRRQQLAENFAQHQATNAFLSDQAARSSAWVADNQRSVQQFRMMQLDQQAKQFAAMAERTSQAPAAPLPGLPAVGPATSAPPTETQPAAPSATGRWPTLLKDPRFAKPREQLDDLLGSQGVVRGGLTSAEYEEIIAAADQMEQILRGMASELNAAEYLAVKGFLDDLIARAKAAMNPGQ